ncbi:MAG: hypothetical protein C5S48_05830 [Candidatus Methanogaster sp.]|nr:MAG: hypothetical protein C5S48_05830 [ANME-2 cluster archaeon]
MSSLWKANNDTVCLLCESHCPIYLWSTPPSYLNLTIYVCLITIYTTMSTTDDVALTDSGHVQIYPHKTHDSRDHPDLHVHYKITWQRRLSAPDGVAAPVLRNPHVHHHMHNPWRILLDGAAADYLYTAPAPTRLRCILDPLDRALVHKCCRRSLMIMQYAT